MKTRFTFLFLIIFIGCSQYSFGQASGDYRSNVTTTGDWSLGANWETFNGTSWVTALVPPSSNDGIITIVNGDSIQLTTATSFDQVIIETGGILSMFNTTTNTSFNLDDDGGVDLTINGKLYISTRATLTGQGTMQNNSGGILTLTNGGRIYVNATNNGTFNVTGGGNINNASITNNGTFALLDSSLNLNTGTLLNNGLISLPATADCFFTTGNVLDTGFITNTSSGIIFKTSATGVATFNDNTKFINNGLVKGFGEYIFANTLDNTGTISPGNNSIAILTVNPAFITGKSPTILLEIASAGTVAGTNYDQLKISDYNFSTTNFSSAILSLLDNALGTVGTTYTIIDAVNPASTILGPFGTNNAPATFGSPVFTGSSVTIQKIFATITWDGGAGTPFWNDANNWSSNIVPSATDNVTISTATTIFINTSAACRGLILNNAALVLSIQTNQSLVVNEMLTLTSGILNIDGGSLVLNGNIASTGTGTITGSVGSSLTIGGTTGGSFGTLRMTANAPNNEIENFTLSRTGSNASVAIGTNGLVLTGIMTLSDGALITNDKLILLSSSIPLTGCIGSINAGASISGLVTVQRFIPQTRKAFRDIAPTINSGSSTIFTNWQEAGVNNNGFGTQITGSVGTAGTIDAATGFDQTQSGNKSMYSMNISTITGDAVWETINSTNQTNDTLSAFKAYRISIRGNRQNDLGVNASGMNAPAILRSKGTLVTGNVSFATTGVTANGSTNTGIRLNSADTVGFSMIGNPYPSPIDWETMLTSSNNLDSSYWVFDPNMGTTGAYVTYNAALHMNSDITSEVNQYLQPGQGFFIRNYNSTSPTLLLQESDKATSRLNLTNVFRTNTVVSKMYFNLVKQIGTASYNMDGSAIGFSNTFSNAIGKEDAGKIENGTDNLAINNNGIMTSIEGRKTTTINDTISLRVWSLTTGSNYQLKVNLANFASNNLQAVLLDRFNNSQTILSAANTIYPFTITVDTNSFNNRFRIVFISSALPITFNSVKAIKKNNDAAIEWSSYETNADYYEVEHSLTATNFNKLATVIANTSNGSSTASYTWLHSQTPTGINYYRIKAFDKSGSFKYSNVVSLDISKEPSITVYPNPIKGNSFSLTVNGLDGEDYSVEIFNSIGQKIFTDLVKANGANNHSLTFKNNKPAVGTYQLVVTSTDGKKLTTTLSIQ